MGFAPDAKAVVGFNCGVIAIAGLFNLLSLLLRKTAYVYFSRLPCTSASSS
jgi:hypothetical protein